MIHDYYGRSSVSTTRSSLLLPALTGKVARGFRTKLTCFTGTVTGCIFARTTSCKLISTTIERRSRKLISPLEFTFVSYSNLYFNKEPATKHLFTVTLNFLGVYCCSTQFADLCNNEIVTSELISRKMARGTFVYYFISSFGLELLLMCIFYCNFDCNFIFIPTC